MSMTYSDHVCTNFGPKGAEALHEHLCEEIDKLWEERQVMREFLDGVKRGPYKDSNIDSYVKTMVARARAILGSAS